MTPQGLGIGRSHWHSDALEVDVGLSCRHFHRRLNVKDALSRLDSVERSRQE